MWLLSRDSSSSLIEPHVSKKQFMQWPQKYGKPTLNCLASTLASIVSPNIICDRFVLYFSCRHRPVLEKCYDIDHIMKVRDYFTCKTFWWQMNETKQLLSISFLSPPAGKDHPGIWWALHLHHVRLPHQRRLLPRCQSVPQAEIGADSNAVPERRWRRLLPVPRWVRSRFAAWIFSRRPPTLTASPRLPLRSHPSGGGEAEPQPGAAHHMPRRPHWLPGGAVAAAEHLHGPSVQAVRQGGLWTGRWAPRPLLIRDGNEGSLIVFPSAIFHSFHLAFHPSCIPSCVTCNSSCHSSIPPPFIPLLSSFPSIPSSSSILFFRSFD